MVLETNLQGKIYVTFAQRDITAYYDMPIEEFIKDEKLLSDFAQKAIEKANQETDIKLKPHEPFSVSFYLNDEEKEKRKNS